ncbi:MAG: hypothetical protein DDT41_01524 [candidate division WS2 bacterium]|nr:hypothetical protein [Candidatus Psychracetigena formicireducens]
MRRDVGSHAHGNSRGAVHQQIWNTRRKKFWLLKCAIKVRGKINRLHLYVSKECLAQRRHSHLCITHCCGSISIYRAKVPLTINHRITTGKILCHSYHRVIDGSIPMWMILSKNLPNHTRRFLIGTITRHP